MKSLVKIREPTNRTSKQLFDELDSLGSAEKILIKSNIKMLDLIIFFREVYNAATTSQHTYYYVYGNSEDTKKLLDIILDIYINPKFNTNEINRERKVIFEEMRTISDSPFMKLYTAIHKKIFAGTSLSRTKTCGK